MESTTKSSHDPDRAHPESARSDRASSREERRRTDFFWAFATKPRETDAFVLA